MKHLKKISISNARRFGKDIEINLSSGANIFLAPNGTGKTTLFEAIEFALTGSVQRLVDPPLSLIRDKQNGVDVRLDFDNGHFCEVNYRKGEGPKLTGDHRSLFPKHSIQDIPFLLRLTHLIEQRGNNWFIQKGEPSQAGDLLDKLSVGKELSAIAKTKTTTLTAATRTINDKKEKRDALLSQISSFEIKLIERDSSKLNYTLQPLDEILHRIQDIHSLFTESKGVTNDHPNLDSVISYKGLVNTSIAKAAEDNQLALIKLSNIESKIPLFDSNKKEIEAKRIQLSENMAETIATATTLSTTKDDILKLQIFLNQSKDQLTRLSAAKQLSDKRSEELTKLVATENHIKLTSDLIPAQREKFRKSTELLEKLNSDATKFNLIRQRETDARRRHGENISLQSILDDWNAQLTKVAETKDTLENLSPQLEQLQNNLNDFQLELSMAEGNLGTSQGRLISLRNTSEAILSAVGIISANLPEDQGICPVCNAKYDPPILREKIELALKEIDPLLSKEIENNKGNLLAVEEKRLQIQNLKIDLDKLSLILAENEEKNQSSQAIINEKCLPKFPDKKDIKEAEEWLTKEKNNNNSDLQNIISEKNTLDREPSLEELSIQKSLRDNALSEIQSLETNINTLTTSLVNIKREIDRVTEELGSFNLEQLDFDISSAEKAIEKKSIEVTEKSRIQQQTDLRKKEIDDKISDLKLTISKLQGQQNEILTQCREIGLDKVPSAEELTNRREILMQKVDSIKENLNELDKLNEELGRWTAAEKYEILNKEIKGICGEQDEQLYFNTLKDQKKQLEEELTFITQKKVALDSLYNQIARELDAVHQQIIAINPLWVSLLKKIVVNPRFVDTHLSSYSYRNKPQADVTINLHEQQVSVMNVASEAQATDLQLTFMLSMASSYKWTPWKSLLLDDPTQHHDLVHASGVFDLLRDYVIDQDYQILMGTHDTVQAKFFQRKLQNENIEFKLWRLIASDDGVRAEAVS